MSVMLILKFQADTVVKSTSKHNTNPFVDRYENLSCGLFFNSHLKERNTSAKLIDSVKWDMKLVNSRVCYYLSRPGHIFHVGSALGIISRLQPGLPICLLHILKLNIMQSLNDTSAKSFSNTLLLSPKYQLILKRTVHLGIGLL